VDIFYLHMPDHNTPVEETLQACNQLHKEVRVAPWALGRRWSVCSCPNHDPTKKVMQNT
jgi:aflatoxin B1 aldehyde reductase